jgi:hypothetical protein
MAKLETSDDATVGKQKRHASIRTLRDLRIAARDGDHAAIRVLLRKYHWAELANAVRRGKPIPAPVTKAIRALTAGTGTHDRMDEWERINARGEPESLLLPDPPSRTSYVPRPILED